MTERYRAAGFEVRPIPHAGFGGVVRCREAGRGDVLLAALEADAGALRSALYRCRGLLLVPGIPDIADQPELLVRLSRLFGPEVEDYRQTLTERHAIHERVPEILVVSNLPPVNRQPPARPEPPVAADGGLVLQFPHRRGWHTDQSFRRPPPDVSLFYAVVPAPKGQGQTLYASGIAAYEALPAMLRARVEGLEGLHVMPGTGRSEPAVRAGEVPQPLAAHQQAQRQPVVRVHPVTGERSLYLCEAGQMDWVMGPFVGMEPGPDGEGAKLLYEVMAHVTRPPFVYAHDWDAGDLAIYDNRSVLHAATWFDAERHRRVMWRTTVMGNPGEAYTGEPKSWIPTGV